MQTKAQELKSAKGNTPHHRASSHSLTVCSVSDELPTSASHPQGFRFPICPRVCYWSVIPEAPRSSQLTLPLAPLAITTSSLGGETHTTFDPPMINQVAHLGRLRSLPPASRDFNHDIQQQFRPGALHTRWSTRAWPATHMMDLLSSGTL